MAYRKQEIKLSSNDVLDPELLNRAILAPAEEVAGLLNEHNVNAATPFAQTAVADEAYWQIDMVSEEVDPDIVFGDCPIPTDPLAHQVTDTYEWERTGDILLTLTTGEGLIQLEAWLQYAVYVDFQVLGVQQRYSIFNYGEGPQTGALNSLNLPRAQFALRVDGIVIEETVTGVENVMDKAPRAIYPKTPGKGDTATSYSIHTFRSNDTTGLSSPCMPVRLGYLVPVSEGSHTFEIVARRIPIHDDVKVDSGTFAGLFHSGWCPLYVYSRKLIAIEHRIHPASTGGNTTFSISAYDESDTLSAASVQGDRLFPTRNQINALVPGNLARGSLRAEHLPSRIMYPSQESIGSGATCSLTYPGFGGSTPWFSVVDSVGTILETKNGPYAWESNPAFVIVWACVYVKLIDCDAGFETQRQQAQFAIQTVFVDATTTVAGQDIGYISASNAAYEVSGQDMYDEYVPVHLLAYFDYRTVPPGKIVDSYRVVASVYDSGIAGSNTTVTWYRGNIQMIGFRP